MFEYDCPLCGGEVKACGSSTPEGEDVFYFFCPNDGVFAITRELERYLKTEATPDELMKFKSRVSAQVAPLSDNGNRLAAIFFSSLE